MTILSSSIKTVSIMIGPDYIKQEWFGLLISCAKFFKITKHFMALLSWNASPSKSKPYLLYKVNIMTADVLATQGVSNVEPH